MARGDIVTLAPGFGLGSKPRPAVVIQSTEFSFTPGLTICPLTTDEEDAAYVRILVQPSALNGLREPSWIMVDKVITLYKQHIGKIIGQLGANDIVRLDQALIVYLGLAG